MILSVHCSIFFCYVTRYYLLADSWLHRLFRYLKVLPSNGEGEKTNVSVRYLGCWGWIATRSWEQDRGCFFPHGRFPVALNFLDCRHPSSINAGRINSQSSKPGNQTSHALSGTKTQLFFMVVRQYYHNTNYYRTIATTLRQEFRAGSEPYALHTWFWSTG